MTLGEQVGRKGAGGLPMMLLVASRRPTAGCRPVLMPRREEEIRARASPAMTLVRVWLLCRDLPLR